MAAFRTLLVAVMLVATALIAVLGFRTTPVFAAGKENVTSIDVPATETVLVSTRTGPENQEVTQADYNKLHDQYNVTPNGTPTITSKTLDTENVETDTGHSKKSYTKETTTWVISDTAPQPAKTATEPASQENPARDNVDLAPLLLVPVTTAIVAPLAAVPAAVATAIPAAIVGGIANAVPAAVVGGALAAVPAAVAGSALTALPAAVAGSALTALPAAVAGSALTALPAAVAGSALTVLPAALTGAALATIPALVKGSTDGFKLGDLLGTLKTVLPAALLGAALNTVPAALVGAALAVPVAAVNAAIPAFIAGTLLGNLVAFPAGVIAGAFPTAIFSTLVGLDVLNHVLPLIPLAAFVGGILPTVIALAAIDTLAKALPLIPAAFVVGWVIPTGFTLLTLGALNKALPFVVLAKLATDLLLALPVFGTIALLAGLNGLKDFVVIPALLALDALNDAVLAGLLFATLAAKAALDLLVRDPLIVKALKAHAKKLAVKAFKEGFKLATLLNKKALAGAAVKALLGLKAFNNFVVKPLLATTALNKFIVDSQLAKAGKKALKRDLVRAFKKGVKFADNLNKINDIVVKLLLADAFNDHVVIPFLVKRTLLGNRGVRHAVLNPLSLGGPVYRAVKGFVFPRTEITKDHLQDLGKVALDNLARVASLKLRTLGAINALNNPFSFGGPLFRLGKGAAFPIPEIIKNLIQNAKELALRNRGLRHAVVDPLSFGGPLFRAVKGFVFPRTEIVKDHLQDLGKVALDNLARVASLKLRTLGAINALNNPFSFGGPLFRLVKGFAFPIPEIIKNLIQNAKELALRNRGLRHAIVDPLSFGGPLFRAVKGFVFPRAEIAKDHLQDLGKVALDNLARDASLKLRTLGAINALNNPLSFGGPLFRLAKGAAFPIPEIIKNLLRNDLEKALRTLGAINALNNPLSLGDPLFRLAKGFLFPIAETLKDLAEDIHLKNRLDWLITNAELLRLLSNPPVIISQLLVLGKPLYELNRDIIAFVLLDSVGQLLFPFREMLGVNFVTKVTRELYKITRANINIMLFEALLGLPPVPTAFISGVQIFEHMEEILGETFIDREIAGFLFATAVFNALLPFVTARDSFVSLALLGSVVFPIIQGAFNAIQNVLSIAKIILFGNGWLITNIELLKIFNNLPVVITQVLVVGKLAAEVVRDLVAFTAFDIVIQVFFPFIKDLGRNFALQALTDFLDMAVLGTVLLPYMAVEHLGLDVMRTIVDQEFAGFIGAVAISAMLLSVVIPLDMLSSIILMGNPLTHLI